MKRGNPTQNTRLQKSTKLMLAGRPDSGWINTAPIRGSTYTFPNIAQWRDVRVRREEERVLSYGARGNDTCHALEDALVELEGGHRACLFPTGQAAIATALVGLSSPGDHILVTDAVYEPVRNFCLHVLERIGVEVEFYLPDGSDVEDLIRPNTKIIYVESPGTATYDIVDLPAIANIAKANGSVVVADNTWGSGWLYQPLSLGADISIMAITKYVSGHSDLVMGAIVTNREMWQSIQRSAICFGQTVGGDEAFMALRGLRTMPLRMAQHASHADILVKWLSKRPEVNRVFFPGLKSDPNHSLWARDCHGGNGLLTVEFKSDYDILAVERMVDALRLFGLGSSWGGYESLVLPVDLTRIRIRQNWRDAGPMLRLHAGLEHPQDLIDDLEQAMTQLRRKPKAI